ncbi:WXG100 family type VII secretion target [Pseudonocardia sp.]|uniref:WXG100 family type VII secretion target n=1 Tax=Pseudonocardia sp. TaxID=60912 RepID=UPI00260C5D2B|nr:WXG100 family type VII secretion target [Pseudonocardia sp.]
MPEIKVSYSTLSTAEADIKASVARLRQSLADLESGLAPMAATWTGEASEFYRATQLQWNKAADELSVLLETVGGGVGTALVNYMNSDNQVRRMWS